MEFDINKKIHIQLTSGTPIPCYLVDTLDVFLTIGKCNGNGKHAANNKILTIWCKISLYKNDYEKDLKII